MNKFITKLAVLAIGAASILGVGGNDAVKASAAVGDIIATFKSVEVVNGSPFKEYRNDDWLVTAGCFSGGVGSSSSTTAADCNLSAYPKYVGDSGVSSSAIKTSAIASLKPLSNVGSITFSYTGGAGHGGGKAYLLYSVDDATYRTVTLTNTDEASQGRVVGSENTTYTFEFNRIASAYYAFILTGGSSSTLRFNNIVMNYIEGPEDGQPTPRQIANDFISRLEALETSMTAESGTAIQTMKDEYADYNEIIKGLIDEQGYSTIIGRIDTKLVQLIKEKADQAAADPVIAEITAIGDITDYTKADQIRAARRSYNALTADQKALVTNYGVLEAAEAAIERYAPIAGEFMYGTSYGQTLGTYATQTHRAATVVINPTTGNGSRLETDKTRVYTDETITFTVNTAITVGITKIVVDCSSSEYANNVIANGSWSVDPTLTSVEENSATVDFALPTEVVFTASAEVRIYKITVYYQGPASANLTSLISDVTESRTCFAFRNAPSYRTRYNALSADEKLVFDTTEIEAEGNITCAAKLAYMEYLLEREEASAAGAASVINDPKEETPITLIVLIAVLGLSVVSAYYFINKRKQQA